MLDKQTLLTLKPSSKCDTAETQCDSLLQVTNTSRNQSSVSEYGVYRFTGAIISLDPTPQVAIAPAECQKHCLYVCYIQPFLTSIVMQARINMGSNRAASSSAWISFKLFSPLYYVALETLGIARVEVYSWLCRADAFSEEPC
jgi:hypothetical protein